MGTQIDQWGTAQTATPDTPPPLAAARYWRAVSRENVEIMRGIYGELARGNFWALAPLLDPEVEWVWAPEYRRLVGDRVYQGPEGVETATREWFEAWDRYSLEAEDFIDAGESVVVLSHGHARTKQGVELEHRGAEVWTLRDGKVVRMRAYGHRADALEAAGLSE